MELNAQIKIFIIIILAMFNISITNAQHQIDKDVTFSLKGEKNFAKLNPFLSYINFEPHESCENKSGIIKFKVTPEGKIASINVEGNLPPLLVEKTKERIMLTEKKWIFSSSFTKRDKIIEFYYPIYLEQSEECKFKIHESYDLIIKLFKKHSIITIDDDTYFIEPMVWHSSIR